MSALPRPSSQELAASITRPVPPAMETGDHLSAKEFERRYHSMPRTRAQLIEGVVYMSSTVSVRHGAPHADLMGFFGTYRAGTPGIWAVDNTSLRLDQDNVVQPDCALFVQRELGGNVKIAEDGILEGAPELIAEIAATSAAIDGHLKKNVYRRNGVREYVIWRVEENAVDWHILRDGEYQLLQAGPDNFLKSEVLPGLWLDGAALLSGEMLKVLDTVRAGCASPEHEAFLNSLKDKSA